METDPEAPLAYRKTCPSALKVFTFILTLLCLRYTGTARIARENRTAAWYKTHGHQSQTVGLVTIEHPVLTSLHMSLGTIVGIIEAWIQQPAVRCP